MVARAGWLNVQLALLAVFGLAAFTRTPRHTFATGVVQPVVPRGAAGAKTNPEVAAKLGAPTTPYSEGSYLPLLALLGIAPLLRPAGKRAPKAVGVKLAAHALEGDAPCQSAGCSTKHSCCQGVPIAAVKAIANCKSNYDSNGPPAVPYQVASVSTPWPAAPSCETVSSSGLLTGASCARSVSSVRTPRAARRVGSGRVSAARNTKGVACGAHRAAYAEMRREHRHAGMKLQQSVSTATAPTVVPLSYDPSRVRGKLQVRRGFLRVPSCRQPALARSAEPSVLARESLHQLSSQGYQGFLSHSLKVMTTLGTKIEGEREACHLQYETCVVLS